VAKHVIGQSQERRSFLKIPNSSKRFKKEKCGVLYFVNFRVKVILK
jgi:hypothetical protein